VSKRAEGSKGDAAVAGIGTVVIGKMENGLCIVLVFVRNALNPEALSDLAF
jgi:hypothetical protein